MLENALYGDRKYWGWLALLIFFIGVGFLFYLQQLSYGLGITGLSRDVTWGFYIAQFTFLVGVAASAVMVVLPYYLHNYKAFGKLTILGEFLAIASVTMCLLFIMVDLGQPSRAVNMILHPTPRSILFWDMVVLNGYLFLNVLISRVTLNAERKGIAPPKWIKPIILLSIPWAVSIHTVTAFIYCGLGARPFWLTAILAPRFLASAFAAGPALLILLCLVIRRFTKFDPGKEPIQKLAEIVAYAMAANIFFVALELFTALYSSMPEHTIHFRYLFFGIEGANSLAPWMWFCEIVGIASLILLLIPKFRRDENILTAACIGVFISLWIDKGLAMVVAGFVPSPLGKVTEYAPTFPELMISLGIYAFGFFLITIFYKIALSVRKELPN
ncbi:MAG: menaquinol oxidoreductase [Candidatus Omnitrophota bacterium]|jgi:molybdopterin-containing oxidoreductase family membrane subunit|nr:MAG: menaquinol oxidoreductase [Candidatus Omnitrophota bacterium]